MEWNNYKTILSVLLIFFSISSQSQILNIDRETEDDTVFRKWIRVIDFSLSSDKLKQNLLDLSAKAEIDRFFKNDYVLVSSASNDFTINGNNVIQNDGYIQFRYRDNDKHIWSNESYLQYQWNDALGMEYRDVAGSNVRKKIFDKEHIDLYTGLGCFFEAERWNWSAVENQSLYPDTSRRDRNIFRLNHYWKFAHKFNDNVDISTISYFQFPLNEHFFNPRWYLDFNCNFKISKNSSCVIHWDNTYDKYRLVPISNFYYSLNFGIRTKW